MKLYEIVNPYQEVVISDNGLEPAEANAEHITAATFMKIMRPLWTDAKFFTAGQPRNNKTSKVVGVGVEVDPSIPQSVVQSKLQEITQAVQKARPDVIKFGVQPGQNNGWGFGGDKYFITIACKLGGLQQERMDFINDVKKMCKVAGISVLTENKKDGANASLYVYGGGKQNTIEDIEAFVEKNILPKYGDRLHMEVEEWFVSLTYR